MLDDARKVPRGATVRGDVVIIGAGAAGITLARSLASTSASVVLLESGGLEPDDATTDLMNGGQRGDPYPLPFTRLRYFGGTTNHWGGWCRPFDPWVFSARPWVDPRGWPIDETTLAPYYEQAVGVVELSTEPVGWQWGWDYWRRQLPLMDTAPLLDDGVVQTAVFRLSPPTRFGKRYRSDLAQSSTIRTLLHANALEIETDDAGRNVTGVRVATLGGNRFRVEGRIVVVAVGGLDVPRLLLLSNSTNARGLGNDHDLVGRYFMDHFEGSVGTAEIEAVPSVYLGGAASLFSAMRGLFVLAPEVMEREELNAVGIGLDVSDEGVSKFADPRTGVTARRVGALRQGIAGGRSRPYDVQARAESRPVRSSRVVLGRDRDALGQRRLELQYARAGRDDDGIRRTLEILGDRLGRAGIGRLRVDLEDSARTSNTFHVGCHLMGTTRMADDPRHGVVDRDLKVHGVDNLYVASSSVFPTVGFSNPTLTIVALTLRLRDQIAAQARGRMTGVSRRGFLGALGGASLVVAVGACSTSDGAADVDVGALPDLFADGEGIDAIGQHAVDVSAVGDDARSIARSLRPPGAPASWLRTASADDLRTELDRAVQADFDADRVVDVAGWRLARTEARVAALVHLTGGA